MIALAIDFQQEQSVDVTYKGQWVGRKVMDLAVERCVDELKSIGSLTSSNQAQAISQGDAAKMTTMLINFRNTHEEDPMLKISNE